MAEARNVRASETRKETRAEEDRPQTAWKPPSLLDAPEVYKRMRAGWNPRPADSVKDKRYPTINHGQWAGSIGVEGMLLCEMPEETFGKMKEYYLGRSQEQNESIPGELDALGRNSGLPIFQERKSTTSQGRDVSVMDD